MIYLFDKDETLLTVFPVGSFFEAIHRQVLNGEDTFEFTVTANNPEAAYMAEGCLVAFQDLDAYWQMYEIKRITDKHGQNLTRTALCENVFYELLDDIITDQRPGSTASSAVSAALTGTRWNPGTIEDLGAASCSIYYEPALSGLQKIAAAWSGELRFRIEISGGTIQRFVDLLAQRGTDTGKQFAYGKDLIHIEREVDLSGLVTALYGRGKGEALEDGISYGRRTTFEDIVWTTAGGDPADKPAAQEWIGDPAALALWGRPGGRHRFGVFIDEEEEDPETLLLKTWNELQERSVPRTTYEMTVVTLEELTGYAHEQTRLGDLVRVIDLEINPELVISSRIIEIERDLLIPENTKIVLGSHAPSIVEAITETRRELDESAARPYNTKWLDGKISILQNEIENLSSYVFMTADDGILILDAPSYAEATKAMKLGGGIFALANTKDGLGGWNWRTFGSGSGFSADEITAGTITAELIQIGPGTTFSSGYDPSLKETPEGAQTKAETEAAAAEAAAKEFTKSRGQNLVTNGTGLLGDNTNFSSFVFDPAEAYSANGSFKAYSSGALAYLNDELIPVEASQKFRGSLYMKYVGTVAPRFYGGLACYDADSLQISPSHHMFISGTHTTLAADLKLGDTIIYLTDATNWMNAAGSATYRRRAIFWNYKNSFGFDYGLYTYSRNVTSADLWADGAIDFVNNTITLSSPWSFDNPDDPDGIWRAGHALSNGNSGGTYKYFIVSNTLANTAWTKYEGKISGIDLSGTNATNAFAPGTAAIKVLFLLNRDTGGVPVTTFLSNIEFGLDLETIDGAQEKADTAEANAKSYAEQKAIDALGDANSYTDGAVSGKITTFYEAAEPIADEVGDLWINTSTDRLYRWSGAAWVEIQDADIAQALASAADAQSTADGKIVSFYTDTQPTATAAGDLWFDTGDNNHPYRWDGAAWIDIQDGYINEASGTAETNAKNYADTQIAGLQSSLGAMAYEDLVELAKLGTTVIDGGYLKTDLIETGSLVWDKSQGGTIRIGGLNDTYGRMEILDADGDVAGSWSATGPSMSEIDVPNLRIAGAKFFKTNLDDYFVDASIGNDSYDGKSATVSGGSGPFRTIQHAIMEAGRIHTVNGNVFIRIAAGTYNETIDILGVLGTNLILQGDSITTTILNGQIFIRSSAGVEIQNMLVNAVDSNTPLQVYSSTGIYFTNVRVNSNNIATAGLFVRFGSSVYVTGCYFSNCTYAGIYLRNGSYLYCNARGSNNARGISVIEGSIFTGSSYAPNGTTLENVGTGGVVLTKGTHTNDPAVPPTYTPPTTTSWTANEIGAWRSVDGWRTDYIMQGYYEGGLSYPYKGFAGFDDAAIRSALSGKTIENIRVKIKRRPSGGYSGARSLYFYSHNYSSRPATEPGLSTAYGLNGSALATLSWNEEKWITLPIAFGNALRDGTARGFCLYVNGSYDYMYIEGSPVLEITYS